MRTRPLAVAMLIGILAVACREAPPCARCDTLVIAATGEPHALLPPLVGETVGRDVSDLIFERLASLAPGAAPVDSAGYHPGLAVRWERVDSLTLRFHLRPGARWHDGAPVSAADVAFSFAAYADSSVDAPARASIAGRVMAVAENDSTVLVRFRAPDPEQWYDATWHVRILPRHIWDSIPRARWAADTTSARLVGSGPYRLLSRVNGRSLTLERADSAAAAPAIRRVIWRFTGDQDAALNLLLSHEADLLETVGDSARVARVVADSALGASSYPSAVYGFLGFNLAAEESSRGRGAPVAIPPFASAAVRRALAEATDRGSAARAVLGPGAVAPPGPMSRLLWINGDGIAVPPFDTVQAGRLLDSAGWRRGAAGVRRRGGKSLSVDILVPASSVARRNLAQVVQEMWRRVGVTATVTSVDFPVFQQRLRSGKFESFVGAWLDEPSPRSLGDQWTAAGIGTLNYTRYRSPDFDSLFHRAATWRGDPAGAKRAWQDAVTQLNGDAPGVWLYTPMNVAGVAKRVQGVAINPFSWLEGLPTWKLAPPS